MVSSGVHGSTPLCAPECRFSRSPRPGGWSAWKTYLAHDGLVAGLAGDRFETRILGEKRELDGSILTSALQRRKCRGLLAERVVDQGDSERGHVLIATMGFELFENRARVGDAAGRGVCIAEVGLKP